MSDYTIDELLTDWKHWVSRGNRIRANYVLSSYAERIGARITGDEWTPDVRLDLERLNEVITTKLAVPLRDVLYIHYLDLRPTKQKYGDGGKDAYYTRLALAKACLGTLWADTASVQDTA